MFSFRNLLKYKITRVLSQESRRFVVKNPGIDYRQEALDINPNELEESGDIDDFESDFMNVHQSHRQHLKEISARKEQEKYLIVNRKYFKQQLPNFLTWHDKEQIRYLHRTNPDEWTIEQLSESFPALPAVIAKIVKSNWTKKRPDKITNHDRSVQKNWQMFKQGQLKHLPNDLIEHLQKFSDRSLNFQPVETKLEKIEFKNSNIKGEFSEIITSYQKLKNKTTTDDGNNRKLDAEEIKPPPTGDTYLTSKIRKSPPITLNELQNQLSDKVTNGENIEIDDQLIVDSIKTQKIIETNCETIDLMIPKYENNDKCIVNNKTTTNKDLKHLQYPDRIKIPKNLLKKGNIYKLNDCYYDYDGEFLYRVPGMD